MTDRGYRILLLAYPARFRRRHGADLIGTTLEASGPAGPSRADLCHLVVTGVRQRFRLPAGRPLTALAVVLAAFIAGGFGAALVSSAAARAHDPAPAVAGIMGAAAPAEAADYDGDATTADLRMGPGADPATVVSHIGEHLRDTGWQVFPGRTSDDIEARDGTLWLQVYGVPGNTPSVYADVTRVAGPAYLPAVLTGLVLGALTGWLCAAPLAHRVVDSRRPVAAATAGAGLVLLTVPTAFLYLALAAALWYSYPGEAVRSLFWVWDSAVTVLPRPFLGLHVILTLAGVLLLAAAAALTRRRAANRRTSVAG